MKVKSVEKLEKSRVALIIEADAQEFEGAIEKAYRKQRSRIMLPGFRKGKAPRKMIEAMYGAEIFYEDAVNEIYPELFDQAVEQEGLDTVAYPEVELLDAGKEGFSFKATVAVRPEVTLGDYKGLTAPKSVEKVTEKDIDEELKPYIQRATRLVDVDRKAKKGDTVTIDFEGFLGKNAFDGGKSENHDLELGSGAFIPGFEDQLIGCKAGDAKDVVVTFPEQYGVEELNGKEATFKVKVHVVKEKVEPKLDDEFAKDVSEFDTLAELKKDVKAKLTEEREEAGKRAFEDIVMGKAAELMEADIPDAMVEEQARRYMENLRRQVQAQGIPFDQYMKMTNMDEEKLLEEAHTPAVNQVRMDLAIAAIAKAENIEVSDEDVEAEFARMADQYGMDVENVKKYMDAAVIREQVGRSKAVAVVADSGIAVKPEPPKEEAPAGEDAPAKPKTARKAPVKKGSRRKQ